MDTNPTETNPTEIPETTVDEPDTNKTETSEVSDKNLTETKVAELDTNPLSYLDRDEFSSERFKVEIRNLPKYYGAGEMKKLLNNKLKLNSNKIKFPGRGPRPWLYVCFRSDDDRQKAVDVLNGYEWKGKKLTCEFAKASDDPLIRKRKDALESDSSDKRAKVDDNESAEDRMKRSVIQYWDVPYDKQLEMKQSSIRDVLKQFGTAIHKNNKTLHLWLEDQQKANDGLPCELLDIRSADKIDGYRNKCEFSVGINSETQLPTVGFRSASYSSGSVEVVPVEGLVHIPQRMKNAVKAFETFIRQSPLKVFDVETQTGHFRQLTARWSGTMDQLMLIVVVNTKDLLDTDETQLKNDLIEWFRNSDCRVDSLYFQRFQKKTSSTDAVVSEHLFGLTHIVDKIFGLEFRVSPEAFFQINTAGAGVLYTSALEMIAPVDVAPAAKSLTLVDICCGTGTIALCFAKYCTQVLGLEIVPQAILDARENAKINAIDNCQFFEGKAEDILSSVLKYAEHDVVAVVDPPRAGLHQRALQQLRHSKSANKLIYIACNPQAALRNFIDLTRPSSKTLGGSAFVPIKAVAVDMFPYTKHCELVIYFERFDERNERFKQYFK